LHDGRDVDQGLDISDARFSEKRQQATDRDEPPVLREVDSLQPPVTDKAISSPTAESE
jgi:hypothetical protein